MIRCKFCILRNSGESLNSTVALITSLTKSNRVFYLYLFTSAFLGKDYFIVLRFLRKGSTKRWNPESGIRKRKRKQTETEYRIKYQWYKIKEFHITQFSTIQREFVLVFLAVPLNIFLLLCLDKVCRSVGYCTVGRWK